MTFDEYVKTEIAPEYQPIVAALRESMRDCSPDIYEAYSYAMPVWKGSRMIIAYIIPSKTHVTFGFTLGRQFTDTYGLLKGKAKESRHIKITKLADINRDALCDYVRQALELDATH